MSRSRMKKKRMRQLLVMAAAVFILVIIVAAAVLVLKNIKKLKSITLTPNFAETELDVNQDYVFSIKGNPSKAKLKSLEYNVDDATATFEKGSEDGTAVLHTGAEGVVTVYIKKDKIESNKITLQVVDQARKAEEEAAAAERAAEEARLAAEAAEATEEEASAATLVMVTGDNVRMRAEANTDCEIVRTCKQGETYERIESVDDWTKISYEGRECYIKTEFLKEVTAEEAESAKAELANKAEEKKTEEKKPEEKKEETKEEKKDEKKPEEQQQQADQAAADAAAAEAEQAKKDAEAAQAAAEEAAKAAAAAAGSVTINCSDGPAQFSKAEYDYFVATWSYTGMADEMMGHHSAAELHNLYNVTH